VSDAIRAGKDLAPPVCRDATDELATAVRSGLLDQIIDRIHQAGLVLAAVDASEGAVDGVRAELDAVLRDIRTAVFQWRASGHHDERVSTTLSAPVSAGRAKTS
jgi:hypothetical protein